MDNPLPFLVDDKGEYRFSLKLMTPEPANGGWLERVTGSKPSPLTFTVTLPFISFQHLTFRRGTLAMFNKDWKPASTADAPTQPATGAPQ